MSSANWIRLGSRIVEIERMLETLDKNCEDFLEKKRKDFNGEYWWNIGRTIDSNLTYMPTGNRLVLIRALLKYWAGEKVTLDPSWSCMHSFCFNLVTQVS